MSTIIDGRRQNNISLTNYHNVPLWVTERNQIISTARVRIAGKNFDGAAKDPNFWEETVTNGGSVVQEGAFITLKTNTSPNGTAKYQTKRAGRFVAGTTHLMINTTGANTFADNNIIRIGAYDDNNGFFMQIDSQVFAVGTRKGGVDTLVTNGNFNGVLGPFGRTATGTYFPNAIEWSPTTVLFYQEGRLMHQIVDEVVTNTSSLPITIENINYNGATTDVEFFIAEATIMRQGQLNTDNIYYHISGNAATHVLKYGPGRLQKLVFNNTSGTSITIYDGIDITGDIIGIITTTIDAIGSWFYDTSFETGLTIVTVGNGLDATVVYE